MGQAAKRFAQMGRNPKDDWRIEDVELVCRWAGVECLPPSNGSHYTVAHPEMRDILTIPAKRPIKPVYITKLVRFIDAVKRSEK